MSLFFFSTCAPTLSRRVVLAPLTRILCDRCGLLFLCPTLVVLCCLVQYLLCCAVLTAHAALPSAPPTTWSLSQDGDGHRSCWPHCGCPGGRFSCYPSSPRLCSQSRWCPALFLSVPLLLVICVPLLASSPKSSCLVELLYLCCLCDWMGEIVGWIGFAWDPLY